MTRLAWDAIGERRFEIGVDRGVLYLPNNSGVSWSGLTSVSQNPTDDSNPYYLDGVKYLDAENIGDVVANLKAFTYPDEFEDLQGSSHFGNGLVVGDQPVRRFGLSYRTLLGNDAVGTRLGYEIHILYSLTAILSGTSSSTIGADVSAEEFSWTLLGTPQTAVGYRPTAHVVLDSTQMDPEVLDGVEDLLYGTSSSDARLPSLQELVTLVDTWGRITITDNGDGTWTATGPDSNITMLDATTFQITDVDATYLDADTYTVRTTDP